MNLPEMIEINDKPKEFTNRLLIGLAVFAAIVSLIIFGLSKLGLTTIQEFRLLPTDLPPIIIKSGSFIIETDKELTKINNRNYKRAFSKGIKGVRIFSYNETKLSQPGTAIDQYFFEGMDEKWKLNERVELSIQIQICDREKDNVCEVWKSPQTIKISDTQTSPTAADFVLTTTFDLSGKKKNKKNKRKFKYEDEIDETVRILGLSLKNQDQGKEITNYVPAADNQEYVLAFYER